MTETHTHTPRIVIVGAGFAGIHAAQALRHARAEVTVVDRRNFHLFQPLLYQVATGTLSPGEIAVPIRAVLRKQRNARVILADVRGFEPQAHRVLLDGGTVSYDRLIVAAGSQTGYFGHDGWAEHAPGLKTIEDALDIRRRVLLAFERAELADDPVKRRALLTFVVVGAGPTGVELAGQVAEMAHTTLRRDFRRIDPGAARVLLVDAGDRVLPQFPERLSRRAERSLEKLGVTVEHAALVTGVRAGAAVLCSADGSTRVVRSATILWAAGVAASPLGRTLAEATAATTDRAGRIVVRPDLTLPGRPEIRVVGDLAHAQARADGAPLPGVAQVAIQQGRYAGRAVAAELDGQAAPPFAYRDPGSIATIGRNRAVADVHGIHLAGYPAWILWAMLHLAFLVGHLNRAVVLMRWAWSYLLQARGGRLITAYPAPAPSEEQAASGRIGLGLSAGRR